MSNFCEDRTHGRWTDAILMGEDMQGFQVHRMMLAASSPFLASLLKDMEANQDEDQITLILPEVPGWVVGLLVQIIYGDIMLDCHAPGNELILETAHLLGLVPDCQPHQQQQPGVEIVTSSVEELVASFSDQDLIQEVESMTKSHDTILSDLPIDIMDYFNIFDENEEKKNNQLTEMDTHDHNHDVLTQTKLVENNNEVNIPIIARQTSVIVNLKKKEIPVKKKNMKQKMPVTRQKEEHECRICGQICRNSSNLGEHFKCDHPEDLPYQCTLCGQQTSDMGRMRRHMSCHQKNDTKEKCEICNKEFRNKVSLRTHRNMVHKLGRKYTCSHCGKVVYSSQYLKKHEATHTGEKFKGVLCKYCGKSVEYTKLKNHELTHTGEKPFQCPDCKYRCIQRSNLRIHMKGVHKKDLPRLAIGQKRYGGIFMDGTAGNNDPFDLRSTFYNKQT